MLTEPVTIHLSIELSLFATMNGTLVPIAWYNTKLDECRVLYADKSEDYLKLDDFNGVDVILID